LRRVSHDLTAAHNFDGFWRGPEPDCARRRRRRRHLHVTVVAVVVAVVVVAVALTAAVCVPFASVGVSALLGVVFGFVVFAVHARSASVLP
jgi:hypothetical protein